MPKLTLLRTTYATEADAKQVAAMLVDKRMVACAQVHKVWSTYRWQGNIAAADEWALEVKVRPDDADAVWEMLLDRHPYEAPCVELLGTTTVPAPYHRWALRVTNRE